VIRKRVLHLLFSRINKIQVSLTDESKAYEQFNNNQ